MPPKIKIDPVLADMRKTIVEQVAKDIETKGLKWIDPYIEHLSPENPITGTVYRGGNRVLLAYVAYQKGYSDNRWVTFKQAKDQGWHVKKGEKSAPIEKWKAFPVFGTDEETGETILEAVIPRCVGHFSVFNAEQIEGMPERENTREKNFDNDHISTLADRLIKSSRCPIEESEKWLGSPCYIPLSDEIKIQDRVGFVSPERFLTTLTHEMVHSTGHRDALDRVMSTKHDENYAFEELIAELGALFVCNDLGIEHVEFDNDIYQSHIAYLQSWISSLKEKPEMLFKAATKADKACDYVMDRYTKVLEQEKAMENTELAELAKLCDPETETIAELHTDMFARYIIVGKQKDLEFQDLGACIEDTLHRLLDEGKSDQEIYAITGFEKIDKVDPDIINEGTYFYIDLDYCLPGEMIEPVKVLPDDVMSLYIQQDDQLVVNEQDLER